jgi:hypothetical protein
VRLIICDARIYPWFNFYVSLKQVELGYIIMEIDNT